ncbi:MAG: adenosylcobalamin-dependent ribonucleoside-diphosphate reductase, partial [Deltaproteobacteria bacterium]|nr:adenosylcobalamin-dependent ribonucleoside-diphosphate reductase [Deltaproteobacteria bacterium]
MKLSENARNVLKRRYLKKDNKGRVIETSERMFKRVARHIAKAEKKYGSDADVKKMENIFYNMMTELKFLPNSPTLMNAGRRLGQLAACFVLPVEDSMDGIFDSLKNAAIIHKSGGGTGFSFSRLRPKNSRVGTTGGIASGPVSFMKIFNTATEQVKQGGTRRGANMAILRVDHPDIMEFIYSKKNNNELNNFNISVGVTDVFMKAVAKQNSYDLIDPRENKKAGELNAAEVYQALVKQAWKNGDPGVIFLDRLNRDNPTPELGDIESTNPCGEQPLLPMEACNLGSVNLAKFVTYTDGKLAIDYKGLKDVVFWSVRFLDNTIDMSKYPLPEINKMVKGNR